MAAEEISAITEKLNALFRNKMSSSQESTRCHPLPAQQCKSVNFLFKEIPGVLAGDRSTVHLVLLDSFH